MSEWVHTAGTIDTTVAFGTIDATFSRLHQMLITLANHDSERMTKAEDIRYQEVCSWAAGVATALDDPDLTRQLQIATLRCHSCGREELP